MGFWDSIKRRLGYQEPKEPSGRSYSQIHGHAWAAGGRRPAPTPRAPSKPQSDISGRLRNFLLADENLTVNMLLNQARDRGMVEISAVGPNRYQLLRRDENGVTIREDWDFGAGKLSGGTFRRTVKDLTHRRVVSDSVHNDFTIKGIRVPSTTIGTSLKRLFENTGRSAPLTPRKGILPSIKAWEIHHAISGKPYIPEPTFVWRAPQERKGFLSKLFPFGRRR